jgi:aromatic ring-opening dioxygenase LigB subunit
MYMGKIISAYIMPHPPVLLPQIGAGREIDVKNTRSSMEQMAKEIAKIKPTTIILSSPHAPCFRDFFYINRTKKLSGSFAGFGHPELKLIFENSLQLAENIIRQADRIGLPAGFLDYEQDNASMSMISSITVQWCLCGL